ncbi:cytochrome b5-like heme/steroid binding domain-containing protein, partial [Baffinella frigidus]
MPPLENEANNLRVYGWEEIKKHDKENDAWVVKDGEVFDVSKFLKEHPGGSSIVLP